MIDVCSCSIDVWEGIKSYVQAIVKLCLTDGNKFNKAKEDMIGMQNYKAFKFLDVILACLFLEIVFGIFHNDK